MLSEVITEKMDYANGKAKELMTKLEDRKTRLIVIHVFAAVLILILISCAFRLGKKAQKLEDKLLAGEKRGKKSCCCDLDDED